MVRKETTEATHKAERTGFPAVQLCAKRLTIVFYEGNPTCSGDSMYFPKIIWIAEEIDSEYEARSVADGRLQSFDVEVQRLWIDVHQSDRKPILTQRRIGGAP